ncbi:GntR family transcriptional regulator [Shouchella shacheensis]|uniref:GntR family transcriptional regulator n=1 Tax=Shouchella shacheensis TaxID=1649580 RepID=UPI00073FC356|nr:GntR family transcriptional regulator [Shouchella shacheensis]
MSVYEQIKEAIVTGVYAQGKRLTEEGLTKDWDVSRTPIRSALKQLEFDGLITPLKRGFTVRTFSKDDLRQIYDLRAMLESYAAGQASAHHTASDIEQMMQANANYEEAIRTTQQPHSKRIHRIIEVNKRFHDAVFQASQNKHVQELISKVVVLPFIYRSFYWFGEEGLWQSLGAHQTIVQAISKRDSERARAAMNEHIFRGRDYVLHYYEGGKTDDTDL